MKEIPILSNPDNVKAQGAFIIFLCHECVWSGYPKESDKQTDQSIPLVFMLNRWDGQVGFPGGKLEEGETLQQCAVRELKEETGIVIGTSELQPFVSLQFGTYIPFISHAFIAHRSFEEMRKMCMEVTLSENFGSEITGAFLAPLHTYQNRGNAGLPVLLRSSLADSVREEIEKLVGTFLSKGVN